MNTSLEVDEPVWPVIVLEGDIDSDDGEVIKWETDLAAEEQILKEKLVENPETKFIWLRIVKSKLMKERIS